MAQDERPFSSKKFIAFMIIEITWKVILLTALFLGLKDGKVDLDIFTLLTTIVVILGFVEVGFLLGQASLDKYIRLAKIAADSGSSFRTRGMSIEPKKDKDSEG